MNSTEKGIVSYDVVWEKMVGRRLNFTVTLNLDLSLLLETSGKYLKRSVIDISP